MTDEEIIAVYKYEIEHYINPEIAKMKEQIDKDDEKSRQRWIEWNPDKDPNSYVASPGVWNEGSKEAMNSFLYGYWHNIRSFMELRYLRLIEKRQFPEKEDRDS